MARAIHRLDREDSLVAALGDEHVLAKGLPVARGFPQAAVEQRRPPDLEVAGVIEPAAHVLLDAPIEPPALGMPEDAADRLFLHVEQVELAAQATVVAA